MLVSVLCRAQGLHELENVLCVFFTTQSKFRIRSRSVLDSKRRMMLRKHHMDEQVVNWRGIRCTCVCVCEFVFMWSSQRGVCVLMERGVATICLTRYVCNVGVCTLFECFQRK